jgi:oligopeptide/dipeptide ABC transporter ATP-binding protein
VSEAAGPPVLAVAGLVKHFPRRDGLVRAVDGVSFTLGRGETLALVGESGCGKSTVARTVLRLVEPTSGSVRLCGEDVLATDRARLRALRRDMQIVFQDPYASLDPRMRIDAQLREPFQIHRIGDAREQRRRVAELLEQVGLDAASGRRLPRDFSGGQRQRIAIARAIALEPALLVCDEPVSSLDVSVQAQILNLLTDLQDERGLAYLFISHDLAVVDRIADRVAVMYLGRVVELGPRAPLFSAPRHPYTAALLSAAPDPDDESRRERIVLRGDPPSPAAPPAGCAFHPRCWKATAQCAETAPPLVELAAGHLAACHHPEPSTSG